MASVMAAGPSLAPIQRLFDREDYKQALKEARVVHRKTPTEESRQLLTRCCLARTDELLKRGLGDEARKLLEELATLRPLADDLKSGLPELLVRAGAFDRYAATFGLQAAAAGELSPALADAAILSGATVSGAANHAEAEAIRKAMAALDAGDADGLAAALEPVPRNSPFADWKLFLRGASAYFRGDDEAMRANWKRLDPARKAAVIAGRLSAVATLAGPTAAAPTADEGRVLAMVERAAFGGEALSHLKNLEELLEGDDSRRILVALRAAVTVLGERSPRLRDRLIELIAQRAIGHDDRELLESLARATSAPAADPKWNRAWALLWEQSDDDLPDAGSEEVARKHWLALVDDLDRAAALSESDRKIAQALILSRVARMVAVWVTEDEEFLETHDPFEWDHDMVRGLIARNRAQVREFLARAQQLAPGIHAPWEAQIKICTLWKDQDGVFEAMTKQVLHFPDDYALLRKIGAIHLFFKNDAAKALEHFEKARRLKPLDESLLDLLWYAHTGAARQAGVDRDFAAARDHLAKAEQCDPQQSRRLLLLAQSSILERKAGNDEAAMRLDEQARDLVDEPTAALLVLATEAARHKLSKTLVKAYRDDWEKLLKKKCSSETAGLMALTMNGLMRFNVDYDGFDKHLQAVCDYVARTTKVKYDRRHLMEVCRFILDFDPKRARKIKGNLPKVLGNMTTRGTKLFPEDPFFWAARGDAQKSLQPDYPWTARRFYERALQRAEESPQLASPELLNHVRDELEEIEHYRPGFFSFPWNRPPTPSPNEPDDDDFDDEPFDTNPFDTNPFDTNPFDTNPFDTGRPAPTRSRQRRSAARRSGGSSSDSSPGSFRDFKASLDLKTVPLQVRAMIEQIAASTGQSVEEVVHEVLERMENGEFPEPND